MKFSKPPVFAIGTGRCGTKFIHCVFELELKVASSHERHRLNDTFHRYCKWYGIEIDHEGFLKQKEDGIRKDLSGHEISFESSSYLSLSIHELYRRFGAKFILLVRSPERVVNSYLRKGWYERPIARADACKPPSYQETNSFHHFLGRLMPSGEKFYSWQEMSRVGKITWYWNALNANILEQFSDIPTENWKIQKLEDFSYESFLDIAQFVGIAPTVEKVDFTHLSNLRPNQLRGVSKICPWDAQEIAEFEREAYPMAQKFNYSLLKKSCD